MSWEKVDDREQFGLGDVEGDGQIFVGNLETEVCGGARRGVIYFLIFFFHFF